VDEDKPLQETELADGVIRGHDGLAPLLTSDTNADIRLLNHSHVVGAVTNGKSHDIQTLPDHLDDSSLLSRAHSAAQNRPALFAKKEELPLQRIAQHQLQNFAVNDNGVCRAWRLVVFSGGHQFFLSSSEAEYS
jgi:hypothetical protein